MENNKFIQIEIPLHQVHGMVAPGRSACVCVLKHDELKG